MYDNANAQTAAGIGQMAGQLQTHGGLNKVARDIPQLQRQADQLEKMLQACHEVAGRIEHAAVRITGPRPAEAARAADPVRPGSETLEQRMNTLHALTEALVTRMNNAASQLDAAV